MATINPWGFVTKGGSRGQGRELAKGPGWRGRGEIRGDFGGVSALSGGRQKNDGGIGGTDGAALEKGGGYGGTCFFRT